MYILDNNTVIKNRLDNYLIPSLKKLFNAWRSQNLHKSTPWEPLPHVVWNLMLIVYQCRRCKQNIMSQHDYFGKGLDMSFFPFKNFIWMNFGFFFGDLL
jgi:hypothetical protein